MRATYLAEVVIEPSFVPGEEVDTDKLNPHIGVELDVALNVLLGARAVDLHPREGSVTGGTACEAAVISGLGTGVDVIVGAGITGVLARWLVRRIGGLDE